MASMTFKEFKKWEKRIVTKKTGPNRGRKAQVLKVFHARTGELDILWMTIIYSGVVIEECNPDNFMFWADFVKDKDRYLPSADILFKAKEKVKAKAKSFGLVFHEKNIFIVIRHGDFPYLVLKELQKQNFLGRARTLRALLRSQNKTYEKFKEEWSTRGWGRHYPSVNAMFYEVKN